MISGNYENVGAYKNISQVMMFCYFHNIMNNLHSILSISNGCYNDVWLGNNLKELYNNPVIVANISVRYYFYSLLENGTGLEKIWNCTHFTVLVVPLILPNEALL